MQRHALAWLNASVPKEFLFMKLGLLAFFCLILLLVPASHAQIGFYINPIATHVTNSVADTGPFAFLGDGVTARTFWGATFGGFTDFSHGRSVDIGVDVRDSYVGANNAHLNSFLLGVRFVGKPGETPLRPYLQIDGGAGSSKSPYSTVHILRGQYGVFGGVDCPLNRVVSFRAVEVGYGSVSTVSSETVGGGSGISVPAARLVSVTSGLVFRIR
jgi:hypothetical protein